LVTGNNPPQGLVEFFQKWSPSVMLDGMIHGKQPTRVEARDRLQKLGDAALTLGRDIHAPGVLEALQAPPLGPFPNSMHPISALKEIHRRAVLILSSDPLLALEMQAYLHGIKQNAELAAQELGDSALSELWSDKRRASQHGGAELGAVLKEIAWSTRAAWSSSSSLTNETGKSKSGRGRALPLKAASPRAFCAAIVLEAWAHVHGGKYPAASSPKLAAAAEKYWLACGGTTDGWGDNRLEAWRPYFEKALEPSLEAVRTELRHHLSFTTRNVA
jgi:hypothetical protein